jgi:FkbM family methyltransferase
VRNDVIGAELILKRYDLQIPRMLRACRGLKPTAFVDVGANFGLYTCIIGKLQLADRLVAFEPDRRAFALLQKHLASNGLTAVESHKLAVGASRSSAVLVPAMGINSGISTVVAAHPEGYEVDVVALDDMLSFVGKPLVIKIDVEGYEQPVLEGAKRLFSQNFGYAQIEVLDERDDSVIVKMTQLGWELRDRINSDFVFWRRAN